MVISTVFSEGLLCACHLVQYFLGMANKQVTVVPESTSETCLLSTVPLTAKDQHIQKTVMSLYIYIYKLKILKTFYIYSI